MRAVNCSGLRLKGGDCPILIGVAVLLRAMIACWHRFRAGTVYLRRSGLSFRVLWGAVVNRGLDSNHSQSVDERSMRNRFPSTLNVTGSAVGGALIEANSILALIFAVPGHSPTASIPTIVLAIFIESTPSVNVRMAFA